MIVKRKYITNIDLQQYCDKRHKELGCEACYSCDLKLRISNSQWCIKDVPELKQMITEFWNEDVEI